MKRRMLLAAAALSLAAALGGGVAGAAPTPKYTVTCVLNDRTVAQWQHVGVSDVRFAWITSTGDTSALGAPVVQPVSSKPPHGIVTIGTPTFPVAPATAEVTFTRADGVTQDVVDVPCS